MKIACIVGARPNFIKIAPIMKEMARFPKQFDPVLVHTGQHYDANMSDIFFRDLDIPIPDFFLEVGNGSQAEQTAAIMERFDQLCEAHCFDRLLVVGDVTSTMACAITAAKRQIPVAHVEAGLRSFDRTMPEEINRIVTDSIADTFFVTEQSGVDNLLREGQAPEKIKLVGNVMIDSLLSHFDRAVAREAWRQFDVQRKKFALVTLHRPPNVDVKERLRLIVNQLEKIASQIAVVFPVHPRTRKTFNRIGNATRLKVSDPLGYLDFLSLMEAATVVITDSGGIQEETTVLGVACLTLRTTTERPITIEVGTNTLIGDDPADLEQPFLSILAGNYKSGSQPELWDGKASARIVAELAGKC
jgi:UDP-N-acetylglucosamine 2-epimerase (non-hydrolysing)